MSVGVEGVKAQKYLERGTHGGGPAHTGPCLLTLSLGPGGPHVSQLSHPAAAKTVLPKAGRGSAASTLRVVQPGTESLIPISECVAKPQWPEGHVSSSASHPRFPCPLPSLTTTRGALTS